MIDSNDYTVEAWDFYMTKFNIYFKNELIARVSRGQSDKVINEHKTNENKRIIRDLKLNQLLGDV